MSRDSLISLFDQRRMVVSETCSTASHIHYTYSIPAPVSLVGVNHSFIYCSVPKTGSSFWKTVLKMIESHKNYDSLYKFSVSGTTLQALPSFTTFSLQHTKEQVQVFLEEAVSFTFVREPYGRLFSAYVDKLFSPNVLFWNKLSCAIIKAVRPNPSADSLKFGHDVTFVELIRYIVQQYESNIQVDRHIAPMHERCNPCKWHFKYIGKMETFLSDTRFIISELSPQAGKHGIENMVDTETAVHSALFQAKRLFLILASTRRLRYQKYKFFVRAWRNLQIRGMLSNSIDMPLSEDQVHNITEEQFFHIMKSALEQPMNTTKVKLQRQEALEQAYRTVPMKDLETLSKYVEHDCLLFGYDTKPKWLFDRETHKSKLTFNYLDAI